MRERERVKCVCIPYATLREYTFPCVGDTNGVLSFPHCFVTNDVVEWRVSNSGSIRSAQERRESSLSSLISCRDKSWESYSAREGGGLPRFITLGACRVPSSSSSRYFLSAIYRPVLLAAFGMIGHVDNASRISVRVLDTS